MRWRLVLCALFGHQPSDHRIDYRPEYEHIWWQCPRCRLWQWNRDYANIRL
jgi:hypothetical protein